MIAVKRVEYLPKVAVGALGELAGGDGVGLPGDGGEVELLAVAKRRQHGPRRFEPSPLDEEHVEEDKAGERQVVVLQAVLQAALDDVLDPRELLRLQRRVEALDLKLVQLLVVQQPVLVLIAHQENTPEGADTQRLERLRLGIVQRGHRVLHRLDRVVKDFADELQLLRRTLHARLYLRVRLHDRQDGLMEGLVGRTQVALAAHQQDLFVERRERASRASESASRRVGRRRGRRHDHGKHVRAP